MSKRFLNYHAKENDAIKGERIVIEARRFSNPVAISGKTSRHGASRVKRIRRKLGWNAPTWLVPTFEGSDTRQKTKMRNSNQRDLIYRNQAF